MNRLDPKTPHVIFPALSATLVAAGIAMAAVPTRGTAETPATILSYYPKAARSAGTEGSATLSCGMTDQRTLKDCSLIGEFPPAWGFGEAAMALSRLSKPNAFVISLNKVGPVSFLFNLHPPSILPNVLGPDHIYIAPDYLTRPDPAEMERLTAAMGRDFLGGRAVLDCVVGLDHKLSACSVVDENPHASGMGRLAVKLASTFELRPLTIGGTPEGDAHVLVPIASAGSH